MKIFLNPGHVIITVGNIVIGSGNFSHCLRLHLEAEGSLAVKG